ncbi:MAG TPA: putative Ig domain-containing protein [Steroidobacteraceae bacterium]
MAARICAAIALLASVLAFATVAEAGNQNCKSRRTRDTCGTSSNGAPSISGTPPASVVAGQTYSFAPAASDPDGNALSFSIVNRPPWASFSASTGRLSGTPSSSAVGEYIEIGISVTDGKSQTSLAPFSVMVTQANQSPVISGTPLTAAREGQAYEFVPSAADADGDALTFNISNRPPWASFNAATGRLSGTPGTGSAGDYSGISIRVSDGVASIALPSFSIDVQQASMGSATLSWLPPTTRIDGSPLTDLAGYRIHYGTSSGSYPNVVVIQNGGVTSAVIGNLPPATYYFVISAYDTTGLESDNSPAVSKTIS